jgi:hypothetical protein
MAKVGGMHSQTNMVLYIIAGIILVGMIFFGVGFKVGNSYVEGFQAKGKGKGKGKQDDNADDEVDPKPNKRKGLGKLMNIAEDIVEKAPKKMEADKCVRFNKIMDRAEKLYKERGEELKQLKVQARQKQCKLT